MKTVLRKKIDHMSNSNDEIRGNLRVMRADESQEENNTPEDAVIDETNVLKRCVNWFKAKRGRGWNLVNGSLAAAVIVGLFTMFITLHDMQKDIEYLNGNVALKNDLNTLENNVMYNIDDIGNKVDSLSDRMTNLEVRVGVLESWHKTQNNEPTNAFMKTTNMLLTEDNLQCEDVLWAVSEVLIVDRDTGEEFTAADLARQPILVSYEQSGQNVVFYGQYSENNRWEGNCIINVYKDDRLILVTEALYDDGDLINYKQAFPRSDSNVWTISKREHIDGENVGDSWNYYLKDTITKDFEIDEISVADVLTVSGVKEQLSDQLESFYHGNTSNGAYNDNTDKAYLVKYAQDGTVKTLYYGRFKNGEFDDDTGNAWYIVRDEKDVTSKYMYYIGKFKYSHPSEDKPVEDKLDIERINEIIEDKIFKCEIIWYGFEEI